MFLSIENVGKVKSAEIEIAGITVIAGENNTGKSTLGEVLFAVFNCFHDPDGLVYREKVKSVSRVLRDLRYRRTGSTPAFQRFRSEAIAQEVVDVFTSSRVTVEAVEEVLLNILSSDIESDIEPDDSVRESIGVVSKRICERLSVPDGALFEAVLTSSLNDEFNDQVNNIYAEEPARIVLRIRDQASEIVVVDSSVEYLSNVLHLNTEAVYLDDPFALDDALAPLFSRQGGHRGHVQSLIRKSTRPDRASQSRLDYIVASGKLEEIYNAIDSVCAGRIVRGNSSALGGYLAPGTDKVLDVRNLSSGVKTFAIIKHLLQSGVIEESGTLILDEPEVHLHPEWQLLFAELIVMLQKQFNLHILLNTHSPYFLNAIQVYSQKHAIAEVCRYYQAVLDGSTSVVEDVTHNVEKIYEQLVAPFQILEKEAYGVS